jgi:hypothetical protein
VHSKRRRSTLSCVASHNAAIVLQRVNTYTADPGLHHLYHRPPPPPPVQQIPAGTRRPGVDGSLERGVGAPGSGISSPEIGHTNSGGTSSSCVGSSVDRADEQGPTADEVSGTRASPGELEGCGHGREGEEKQTTGLLARWGDADRRRAHSFLGSLSPRLSEVIFVMHSAKQDAFCVFGIAIGDTNEMQPSQLHIIVKL